MTSTALTTTAQAGLTPTSIEEAQSIAEMLAKSVLIPDDYKGKPADCFMAITYGVELGFSPVTALMSIAVIKGRPSLYANAMVALVMSSGEAEFFRHVESDNTHAIYETRRKGSDTTRRYEFSYEDAKSANLLGGMYSKYPKQMFEARAKAFLAKDVYPNIMHGLDSYEEIIDIEPAAVDVDKFEAPKPELPEQSGLETEAPAETSPPEQGALNPADMITECQSVTELEALGVELAKLRGDERESAKELYDAHMATLVGSK